MIYGKVSLMIRMYLGVYIGDYERFMLSLPDSIINFRYKLYSRTRN